MSNGKFFTFLTQLGGAYCHMCISRMHNVMAHPNCRRFQNQPFHSVPQGPSNWPRLWRWENSKWLHMCRDKVWYVPHLNRQKSLMFSQFFIQLTCIFLSSSLNQSQDMVFCLSTGKVHPTGKVKRKWCLQIKHQLGFDIQSTGDMDTGNIFHRFSTDTAKDILANLIGDE